MKYTFSFSTDEVRKREITSTVESDDLEEVMEVFLDFLKGTGYLEDTINEDTIQRAYEILDRKMGEKFNLQHRGFVHSLTLPDLEWLAEDWTKNQIGFEESQKVDSI